MLTIKLFVTKLILTSTIHFAPAPAPSLNQTVDTQTLLAGLDKATATLAR